MMDDTDRRLIESLYTIMANTEFPFKVDYVDITYKLKMGYLGTRIHHQSLDYEYLNFTIQSAYLEDYCDYFTHVIDRTDGKFSLFYSTIVEFLVDIDRVYKRTMDANR